MTQPTLNELLKERYAPRVVGNHVEVWEDCPYACHGFGVCSWCHDQGGKWVYSIELTRSLNYVGKHREDEEPEFCGVMTTDCGYDSFACPYTKPCFKHG